MGHRTDPQQPAHASRDCGLCGTLRHPVQAKQGRELKQHLAEHPLPRQQQGAGR